MRRFLVPALAVVAVVLGCGPGVIATETRTRSLAPVWGTGLVVRTGNGGIDLTAHPAETSVTVRATLACGGRSTAEAQDRLARATLTATRDATGLLTVATACPDPPRSGDGADVSVRLPIVFGADLETSNGPVEVSGTGGLLTVRTSNGAVSVTGHDGPGDLDTSNGAITVQAQRGRLIATTSNGPVDVALTDDATGSLTLDTSNGRVDASVGPSFTGRVTFDTSNGGISVVDPGGRIVESSLGLSAGYVIVGTGGTTSRLTTSNGSIRLSIR